MKPAFKHFLVTYVSYDMSPIADMSSIYELDELTDTYLSRLNPDQLFTVETTMLYLEFLEQRLSEESKRYFILLEFNEWRYIEQLELMVRSLVQMNE